MMLKLSTFSTENPLVEIEILGQKIPFLVETGAAISVLKQSALKVTPSRKTLHAVGASEINL